jgi:hypothetical protein
MSNNDFGLAFPSGDFTNMEPSVGMTIRDYFAAKALAALLSKEGSTADLCFQAFAECAYQYADAMLKVREVKP